MYTPGLASSTKPSPPPDEYDTDPKEPNDMWNQMNTPRTSVMFAALSTRAVTSTVSRGSGRSSDLVTLVKARPDAPPRRTVPTGKRRWFENTGPWLRVYAYAKSHTSVWFSKAGRSEVKCPPPRSRMVPPPAAPPAKNEVYCSSTESGDRADPPSAWTSTTIAVPGTAGSGEMSMERIRSGASGLVRTYATAPVAARTAATITIVKSCARDRFRAAGEVLT